MHTKNKATIKDVARLANVSISTVSRAINAPLTVKMEKRQAVEAAVQELGYVPDPVARALSGKRSRLVAVVVPNLLNGCIAEIVNGALSEMDANACDLVLFTCNEDPRKEENFLRIIQEKMLDGAIFVASAGNCLDFEQLAKIMPVALVDRYEQGEAVHCVNVDDRLGIRRILEHMRDCGMERLGFLAGDLSTMSGKHRLSIFKEVAAEEGISLSPSAMVGAEAWSLEAGYRSFERLMKHAPDVQAVLCSSDCIAHGALEAARGMGISVPEELCIFGFDNFPISAHTVPALSTLNYPHFQMGKIAAKSVIQSIHKPESDVIKKVIPVDLLLRESSR